MDVRLNVWGIDGRFGKDEFMWEDLEVVELCGPPLLLCLICLY